jgi:S-DNA-T family DNA segregation ATPase FtsK/SpoIIIE
VQNGQLFIEVGKPKPDIVLASKLYLKKHIGHPLRITLGIDMDNKPTIIDLEDNTSPHLLIAGTTGSGKSVMLRHIITSLIANTSPHVVRLTLMDFKVTEFPVFEYAKHVDRVITSVDDALAEFEELQAVMEDRYLEMQRRRVRLASEAGFSHIVVAMDEFADMILQGGKEIEQLIGRIAAMGRAAGIHLILSTQRPSVDVVAGLVRANFPARIALRVMDGSNSQIILGQAGAETLVGCGDSLLLLNGRLTRFQGAFVSDQEVEALVASRSRGVRRLVPIQPQQPKHKPTFWERLQDFGDEMRDAWERGQQSA